MNNPFVWIDAHQVLSAFVLLFAVITTGLWISHRQKVIKYLQGFVKTLALTPCNNEYSVASIEVGKYYPIMIRNEETSFLVRSINERFAVFEVLVSPIDTYGRSANGWTFKIDRVSISPPELYASAFLAGYAMEKRFSVGNSRRAHA